MFVAALASVVGTVVSGIGAYQQAQAQASAAEFNAAVQRRNAEIAGVQGKMQADDQQRQGEEALGRMRAAYGSAGVEFSGDALGVYQDSAAQANYDIQKIHYNTRLREIGYQDQAALDEQSANSYSSAAMFGLVGSAANTIGAGIKGYDSIFTAT